MKGNEEVAMALMEQLLQPHNPVTALRSSTWRARTAASPTNTCFFPNPGICGLKRLCLLSFCGSFSTAEKYRGNSKEWRGGKMQKQYQKVWSNIRSRITINKWGERGLEADWYLRKVLNVKEKKQSALKSRGKLVALNKQTQRTAHLLTGAQCERAVVVSPSQKRAQNSGSELVESSQVFKEKD